MCLSYGYCAIGEEGEENKLHFVGCIALLYCPALLPCPCKFSQQSVIGTPSIPRSLNKFNLALITSDASFGQNSQPDWLFFASFLLKGYNAHPLVGGCVPLKHHIS